MNGADEKSKDELLKETMQFRFFGQRFTPDAYMLNRLTQGDESADPETGQKLPSTPTSLMVASLINSDNKITKNYLDAWVADPARIKQEGRESDKVIGKVYDELKNQVAGYSDQVWTQNIYWSWLDCYRSLLSNYGNGYPVFMMNEDWQKKNLGTVLGSYTELKHDTLLYAKQSYAELGGGGDNPKLPETVRGYVEPDYVFWSKLLLLTETTRDGLKARNNMPEEYADRYDALIETLQFIKDFAGKELKNEKINDDDFEKLRTLPSIALQRIVEPVGGEILTDKEKRAGIIADIHTDARLRQILYQATGKPYTLFVAVRDVNGARLTRGAVYRHYEFTGGLEERLSDEDWQAKVYLDNGMLPTEDRWSQELIVK
jgi:hypothetical protein